MLFGLPQVSRNLGLNFVGLSGPCRPGLGHGSGTQSAKSNHLGSVLWLPQVSRDLGVILPNLPETKHLKNGGQDKSKNNVRGKPFEQRRSGQAV